MAPISSFSRTSARALARLGLAFGALVLLGACANVIGIDGVEYDRRLCGVDDECTLPSICRGNANGTFYCEPPPAVGAKFAEKAYASYDNKGHGIGSPSCLSGLDDGNLCTRPCRVDAHCGGKLPKCRDLPLAGDGSRSVPVCQKN